MTYIIKQLSSAVLGGYFGMRGLVQHLAVEHKHQRRGIATALMNACCDAFNRRGIRLVLLAVTQPESNQPASMDFYRSVGFVASDSVKLMWKDV